MSVFRVQEINPCSKLQILIASPLQTQAFELGIFFFENQITRCHFLFGNERAPPSQKQITIFLLRPVYTGQVVERQGK
jgi:hypothetical protein